MTLFSSAFIFVGSICFALGLFHLLIFLRRRDLRVDLVFSCMAFAIALSSYLEILAFKTGSMPEYTLLLKGTLAVQCILWTCFGWFVYYFTKSGRLWLPILITVLYGLAQVGNIISSGSILFSEISELHSVTMQSGEILFLGNGLANPFRIIGDIAWILLLIYTATAFVRFGKKGNSRKAIVFGITIFLCLGLGYLHGTLIDLGIADPPYLGSFLFLPLSLVISHSLAGDVAKASILTEELRVKESRWRNLLESVQLLVVGIDRDKSMFYANPFFLNSTGYDTSELLNQPFSNIVRAEDREALTDRMETVFTGKDSIMSERALPIITRSGEHREIIWSNVLVSNNETSDLKILSIGRDITSQIQAETERDRAIENLEKLKVKLENENISLREVIQTDHGFKEIIGKSNGLLYVLGKIQQVASTDTTVLVLGETGTGKELVARAVHRESDRKNNPFIRVNCAAIPADLVESELFGHEPGSFTNAINLRRGKFELAEGGTIFLDEISEMPLESQAKLLTVLQEKEMERVGGAQSIPVDVRVISATNRDLGNEVAEGRFRADLYYRLNVYPITLPPLRNRREDIPLLIAHFISVFNRQFGKDVEEIPPIAMETLINYDWPGNIRELQNVLERAVITNSGPNFYLPDGISQYQNTKNSSSKIDAPLRPLAEVEKKHILDILKQTDWQISGLKGAASILEINPSTLRSRIKKLGLKKP